MMMMIRVLIVALLICFNAEALNIKSGQSNPLPLSPGGVSSSGIVEGVCVISGKWNDAEVDLIMPGPEPLVVERYYQSSLSNSWSDNLQNYIYLFADHPTNSQYATRVCGKFRDPSGAQIYYSHPMTKKDFFLTLNLAADSKGLTNCGLGELGARTNLKNTQLYFNPSTDHEMWANLRNGERCRYVDDFHEGYYVLSDWQKGSGNHVLYEYNRDKLNTKVTTVNAFGKPFASLIQHHLDDDTFWSKPRLDITASDGRTLSYTYSIHKDNSKLKPQHYLESVTRPNAPQLFYEYYRFPYYNAALIKNKRWPDGRFLRINYYTPEEHHLKTKNYKLLHVKEIQAPVGKDQTPITTHRFDYHVIKQVGTENTYGWTNVWDAYGRRTAYHYGIDQRLHTVQKFNRGDQLYSQEKSIGEQVFIPVT